MTIKNLTPKAMRCGPRNCPSVHQLEDGRLLIVGRIAEPHEMAGSDIDRGDNEEVIIIDPALLDDVPRGWHPTHRHIKGDKQYRKEGQALHTETGELLVIYSTESGVWYARPKSMFEDGRFEELPLPPTEREGA